MEPSQFFNSNAGEYYGTDAGMGTVNELAARHIEKGVSGRVLSIGGLWPQHSPDAIAKLDLVVADVSEEMLRPHREAGISTVLDDARALSFEDESFDHVVLPLVLHHITEQSWRAARREVHEVLAEVGRVLKRGGRVWISEFAVRRPVYWAEALAAPATKLILGLAGIPLVVMHSSEFYYSALLREEFGEVESYYPNPADASWRDPIRPIIGLPWLKVPRGLYPVRPVVLSAKVAW
ncbi:MAG: class I SAM-dependent methyltransferase [Deltaproteobacteria bacterium]|nr:class I SAM-dependent methyltransferase [Deltaproteobacteria bacterium]MBW2159514.1 class I SAM-dependent methyltransferase [Deltaproteobacteria bacterium]